MTKEKEEEGRCIGENARSGRGRDMNDWKEEEEVEKVDKGNRKREDTLLDD